jgi:hypothetical protein
MEATKAAISRFSPALFVDGSLDPPEGLDNIPVYRKVPPEETDPFQISFRLPPAEPAVKLPLKAPVAPIPLGGFGVPLPAEGFYVGGGVNLWGKRAGGVGVVTMGGPGLRLPPEAGGKEPSPGPVESLSPYGNSPVPVPVGHLSNLIRVAVLVSPQYQFPVRFPRGL